MNKKINRLFTLRNRVERSAMPLNLWKWMWLMLIFVLFNTYIVAQSEKDIYSEAPVIEDLFLNPPVEAGTWVYWWWLNGYVSKEGIIRELDEMKDKGISGAIIFHAGNGYTPGHTPFMSDQWRAYFKYAVEEAARRGITITLNICEGWNAGGPWITEEHASMKLQSSKLILEGPGYIDTLLPDLPEESYRKDLFTYAWQIDEGICSIESWLDLSSSIDSVGRIKWLIPDGKWIIVRFGKFVHKKGFIHYSNDPMWIKEKYFEANEMDSEALRIHFNHTAKILIEDVKEYVGKTFTHLHIDSGETGHPDWTPGFYAQFQKLRGYNPEKFMAAKAGITVENKEITQRFLEDYMKTQGDMIVEGYYGGLAKLAKQYKLGTHSEAAGYQKPDVDALQAMGVNDIVMAEFWSRTANSYIHQASQKQLSYQDGIKNAASAAHIYGRKIVQAEAYTATGLINYTVPLYNLKDIGDRAFCQGLNRTVLHHFVHQPETSETVPGYSWPGIGISFNVNRTWWNWSSAWFSYLNRTQTMLQSGHFVADICYFQGEWVSSYVPAKWLMDPSLPQGYDCDVINTHVLRKATVNEKGELVLPGGMTYRYLIFNQGGKWEKPPISIIREANKEPLITKWPDISSGKPLAISPLTMLRIKELVSDGITLIGPPPDRPVGLSGYPTSDEEVSTIVKSLWGENPGSSGSRQFGKGRVIWGKRIHEITALDGLLPDLEYIEDERTATLPLPVETASGLPDPNGFDWIHRKNNETDYYFLANFRNTEAGAKFIFRINDRQPELWDPLNGKIRDLEEFTITNDERISIPLKFAPRQSYFILFRKHIEESSTQKMKKKVMESVIPNFPSIDSVLQLMGEWSITFDSKLGGPEETILDSLKDWRNFKDDRIRYYSGIATYTKEFKIKRNMINLEKERKILLDLGRVEVMARVFINGQDMGTLWTAPWQVDITNVIQSGKNIIEIQVVNLWRNRMIGDAAKPENQRITKTNINVKPTEVLRPSGLIGPVLIKSMNKTNLR